MKSLLALAVLLVVGFAARPAAGQSFVFSFDENGHGTQTSPTVLTIPFSTTPAPLTYHLAYPSIAGDILITEPPNNNILSDLLRFDNQGNVTVFSEFEQTDTPDLADVPVLPNAIQPFIVEPETGSPSGPGLEGSVNGLFGYSPAFGSGFPGAPATSGVSVTINFTSDTPEPGSALLVSGLGLALLLRRPRRTA